MQPSCLSLIGNEGEKSNCFGRNSKGLQFSALLSQKIKNNWPFKAHREWENQTDSRISNKTRLSFFFLKKDIFRLETQENDISRCVFTHFSGGGGEGGRGQSH